MVNLKLEVSEILQFSMGLSWCLPTQTPSSSPPNPHLPRLPRHDTALYHIRWGGTDRCHQAAAAGTQSVDCHAWRWEWWLGNENGMGGIGVIIIIITIIIIISYAVWKCSGSRGLRMDYIACFVQIFNVSLNGYYWECPVGYGSKPWQPGGQSK